MARITFTLIEEYHDTLPEPVKALADAEGFLWVEVTAYADMILNDYGVERSPVWYEPQVTGIDFEINGETVKSVPDELWEMAADRASRFDSDEWE
jgi:hypothetical protein